MHTTSILTLLLALWPLPALAADTNHASLSLALSQTTESVTYTASQKFILTVKNTGTTTTRIDKDLVLFFDIEAKTITKNQDAETYQNYWRRIDTPPSPSKPSSRDIPKARFIDLSPGQEQKRTIDLTEPTWRYFFLRALPKGQDPKSPTYMTWYRFAAETQFQFQPPDPHAPLVIRVKYQCDSPSLRMSFEGNDNENNLFTGNIFSNTLTLYP